MEKTGKALGDQKMVLKGKARKAAGKVQNAIGGLQDTANKRRRPSAAKYA